MSFISIHFIQKQRRRIQLQGLLLGSFRATLGHPPSPDKHHVGSQSGG